MKIAVTNENGMVFQHFGHTPGFVVFTAEDDMITGETLLSSGETGHGALTGLLADENVDVLICGGIGGGAISALEAAGIKVVGGAEGNVRAVAEAYLKGTLKPKADFTCHHHDHEGEGHDCGSHGHSCGSASPKAIRNPWAR